MKYSVRILLLFVAVAAVSFRYASMQWRIAKELRANDVAIFYRFQYKNWEDTINYTRIEDADSDVFIRLVGPDLASTVVEVEANNPYDPARVAELCAKLPELRRLTIQDCDFSDADLAKLVGLSELHELHLRGTSLTDLSMETLARMKQLRVLNISETSLSFDAIKKLRVALPTTQLIRHGHNMM